MKDKLFGYLMIVAITLTIIVATPIAIICAIAVGIEYLLFKVGLVKERWLYEVLDSNAGSGDWREGVITDKMIAHRKS